MKRVVLLPVVLALTAGVANAQSIKINGLTTARYIELRQISSQQTLAVVPLTQDLQFNVWGLGTGVRVYGELRGRLAAGENQELWPQADDEFDVVAAFAELDRTRFRVRAGRQWKTSPLGYYNFDGGSLLVRPAKRITAEVYGGWSLLRGENDDLTDPAIAAVEQYTPDIKRNLIGAELKVRFAPGMGASALYQREIRTDRAGLESERAAGDASVRIGRVTLDGGVEADIANEVVNEARVRAHLPLTSAVSASLEARRYRPYFDLWTIWGAFNPIGFSEAVAMARWSRATTTVRAGGGLRRYGDDDGGVEFDRLREDGWRAFVDAVWMPVPLIQLNGGYRVDIGFGASRSQGNIGAQLNIRENSYIGLNAVAFQMINELQITDGTVYGLGTDARFALPHDTRLGWSFAVYRHDNVKPTTETDWSQLRGSLFVEWSIGSNPDQKQVARAK